MSDTDRQKPMEEIEFVRMSDIPAYVPTPLKVTKKHVTFYPPKEYGYGRSGYFFELRTCDTPEKLLRWICHLTMKTWFTNAECRALVHTLAERFGWKIPNV